MNKRLIPVIHVNHWQQAVRNAMLCNDLGLGCFLIHHRASYKKLFEAAEKVKEHLPDMWIGINALDLSPIEVLEKAPKWVNAIWVDNGGVVEKDGGIDCSKAEELQRFCIYTVEKNLEFFGGFAFKYQNPVTNLEEGAKWAAIHFDTVTTSGDGTGIAADIEKIKRIHSGILTASAVFKSRLGIASGITPENVDSYLPYVDDFLVSTGISKDEFNLDKEKVTILRDKINAYVS
jgi:predicted TIM-barrel enzyme